LVQFDEMLINRHVPCELRWSNFVQRKTRISCLYHSGLSSIRLAAATELHYAAAVSLATQACARSPFGQIHLCGTGSRNGPCRLSQRTDSSEDTYRIGAVSRITGIPADTLRASEPRYGVVEPSRSDGRFRHYSKDDVARLALIKELVNSGDAISSVANLPILELQDRMESDTSGTKPAFGSSLCQGLRAVGMRWHCEPP